MTASMADLPDDDTPILPAAVTVDDRQRWLDGVVAAHERSLLGYASHLAGSVERGRDLVQEAFARLCAQHTDVPLPEWLFVVCRNLAVDRLRKERRMTVMEQAAVEDRATVPADAIAANPAMRLVRDDESRRAVDALGMLPPRQQEALRLKFQQELSYAQIAAVMQTNTNNVAVLVHAGLKALRATLGE